jgi:hypothetical protein
MYILISRNTFDGTKRYEYPTREKALSAYEATRSLLIMLPGGPTTELILYEDSVNPKNEIKRCIVKKQ